MDTTKRELENISLVDNYVKMLYQIDVFNAEVTLFCVFVIVWGLNWFNYGT